MPPTKTLKTLSTSLEETARNTLRNFYNETWSELLGKASFKLTENKHQLKSRFNAMCEEIEMVFTTSKSFTDNPNELPPPGTTARQLKALRKAIDGLDETSRGFLWTGFYRKRTSDCGQERSQKAFNAAQTDCKKYLQNIELALEGSLELAEQGRGRGGHNRLPFADRLYIAGMAGIYKDFFRKEPTTTAEPQSGFGFTAFLELVTGSANKEEPFPYNPHSIGLGLELFRENFSVR